VSVEVKKKVDKGEKQIRHSVFSHFLREFAVSRRVMKRPA
jgi:hypothetical protein